MASERTRRLTSALIALVLLHQLVAATAWAAHDRTEASPSAGDEVLIEAPHCAEAIIGGPNDAPAPDTTLDQLPPGTTKVEVIVPAMVRARVEGGQVVAVTTNTGCAPRPSDLVIVVPDDRAPTPTERAQLAAFRHGDWREAGRWHAGAHR